jgi:hypothetical protein
MSVRNLILFTLLGLFSLVIRELFNTQHKVSLTKSYIDSKTYSNSKQESNNQLCEYQSTESILGEDGDNEDDSDNNKSFNSSLEKKITYKNSSIRQIYTNPLVSFVHKRMYIYYCNLKIDC